MLMLIEKESRKNGYIRLIYGLWLDRGLKRSIDQLARCGFSVLVITTK